MWPSPKLPTNRSLLKSPKLARSEEHTSELQSPCISYAVFCLKKKKNKRRSNVQVAVADLSVERKPHPVGVGGVGREVQRNAGRDSVHQLLGRGVSPGG